MESARWLLPMEVHARLPLRREQSELPAIGLARVELAVVQPIGLLFPELYTLRHEPIAGPKRRAWYGLAVVLGGEPLCRVDEIVAGGDLAALVRDPGADLAAARASREILIRFGVADQLGSAFDSHLTL